MALRSDEPKAIDMSQFYGGRNGYDEPDYLLNSQGYPNGQCVEQINCKSNRNSLDFEKTNYEVEPNVNRPEHIGEFLGFLIYSNSTGIYYSESLGFGSPTHKISDFDGQITFLENRGFLYTSSGGKIHVHFGTVITQSVGFGDTFVYVADLTGFNIYLTKKASGTFYLKGEKITYTGVDYDNGRLTGISGIPVGFFAVADDLVVGHIDDVDKEYRSYQTFVISMPGYSGSDTSIVLNDVSFIDLGASTEITIAENTFPEQVLTFTGINKPLRNLTGVSGADPVYQCDFGTKVYYNITTAIEMSGSILVSYLNRMWVAGKSNYDTTKYTLNYGYVDDYQDPENFWNFVDAYSHLFPNGGGIKALLRYKEYLIVAQENTIHYIDGYNETLNSPNAKEFNVADGVKNKNCISIIGDDVVYYNGRRIKRLFTPEFQGFKSDSNFDRPVRDILDDGFEIEFIFYNSDTHICYFCSENDGRLCYSAENNSWWIETIDCLEMIKFKDKQYFISKDGATNRLYVEGSGAEYYGLKEYQSRHLKLEAGKSLHFYHFYIDGYIDPSNLPDSVEIEFYIDGERVKDAQGNIIQVFIGDSDRDDNDGIFSKFSKTVAINSHGREFYYIIRVGSRSELKVKTAVVFAIPDSSIYRKRTNNG